MQPNNSQKQKLKPGQIMSWRFQVQAEIWESVVHLLNFDEREVQQTKRQLSECQFKSRWKREKYEYVKWEQ